MKTTLIGKIIHVAQARGVNQKALAVRAGLPEETVSRAKKRGSAHWAVVEALANAAGVTIGLVSGVPVGPPADQPPASFRERYHWLAWANPNASDEVLVRSALVNPEFQTLLDAAIEFGVNMVIRNWDLLKAEGDPETLRALPITDRIIRNIRYGYQQANA